MCFADGAWFLCKGLYLGIFYFTFWCQFILVVQKQLINGRQAIRNYIVALSIILLCILPWTFALHQKYNVWSITTLAGKLNTSWYINSGKTFKPDIKLLIPPTYYNSPSFWEDPYVSQDKLSGPFSSMQHFVKWIVRIVHTSLTAIQCFNEISFLGLGILLISFFYFSSERMHSRIPKIPMLNG